MSDVAATRGVRLSDTPPYNPLKVNDLNYWNKWDRSEQNTYNGHPLSSD